VSIFGPARVVAGLSTERIGWSEGAFAAGRKQRLIAAAAPDWRREGSGHGRPRADRDAEGAAAFAAADPDAYPPSDQDQMLDLALWSYGLT
jgi:hypothetical protein